jgi:hypothetical protein
VSRQQESAWPTTHETDKGIIDAVTRLQSEIGQNIRLQHAMLGLSMALLSDLGVTAARAAAPGDRSE